MSYDHRWGQVLGGCAADVCPDEADELPQDDDLHQQLVVDREA